MNSRLTSIAILSLMGAISLPSFAGDAAAAAAKEMINLKDGSTLYVFSDGKMALESKYGKAEFLMKGQTLQTADGRTIKADSNDIARWDSLLKQGHGGYGNTSLAHTIVCASCLVQIVDQMQMSDSK